MNRLSLLREYYEYTQYYLCEYLKISQSTYSKYENEFSIMPYNILIKLSDLYNVSIDYILCRTDIPTKPEKSVNPYRL